MSESRAVLPRPGRLPLLLALLCALSACQGVLTFEARRTLSGAADVAGAHRLQADFRHGDLAVVGEADRDELAVTLDVTVVASSQAIADEVAADLELVSARVGDVLRVSAWPSATAWPEETWQLHVHSRFEVPRSMGLDVSTTHGDLDLRGVEADVRARTTHGDVEIRDVVGDLDVRSTHGRMLLSDVSGERHQVSTTHDDVDVRALRGDFSIETTHGDVSAQLGRLDGEHAIETTHGSIHVELDAASSLRVAVRTSHGRIRGELPGVKLDVENDRAEFSVGAGAGRLRLETSHADVTVRALQAADEPR